MTQTVSIQKNTKRPGNKKKTMTIEKNVVKFTLNKITELSFLCSVVHFR